MNEILFCFVLFWGYRVVFKVLLCLILVDRIPIQLLPYYYLTLLSVFSVVPEVNKNTEQIQGRPTR